MTEAAWIWAPQVEDQRLTVVAFRREFELEEQGVEASMFHLFAHSHYHLHVNGIAVGYGPARSMPTAPSYDSYDISPYLRAGKNVIAVLVAHAAAYSFHHMAMPGALVAWGNAGAVDVASNTSDWRCCVSLGHEANPPRWSFAIPVIEICDERQWPQQWSAIDTPTGVYVETVEIDKTQWGALCPREMPHLTQNPLQAEGIERAYTYSAAEKIHGFRRVHDFKRSELAYAKAQTCAYTWIWSDSEQEIIAGTWWGEHYLNGEALQQMPTKEGQCMRNDVALALNSGWNLFFVSYGMTQASWEFQIALPSHIKIDAQRGVGVESGARVESGAEAVAFYVSQTVEQSEFAKICPNIPQNQEYISQLACNWSAEAHQEIALSPERRLAWAIPEKELAIDEDCPFPFTVPATTPSSVIVDFGRIGLGRLSIDVEAPAGTVFDIYYVEELKNGRPDYAKSAVSCTVDRRIAAGNGRLEWFFPRGCKYVEIAVAGHSTEVIIKNVQLIEMRYPYSNDGAFSCSDPRLTKLWEYGVEALRNCSEDVITDCPWRERTMYGGDFLVEMAVGAVYSRDLDLVRRCVTVYLQSQNTKTGGLPGRAPTSPQDNPLGEYQLMIVLAASWHLRLTGDIQFARGIAEKLTAVMQQFTERDQETGLYVFSNTFIEHTPVQKSGLVCAGNASLAGAYRGYADFLKRLGREKESSTALAEATALDTAINQTFWDEDEAAYKTGVGDANAPGNPHQLHASFYPGCFASSSPAIDQALAQSYPHTLKTIADDPTLRSDEFHGRQDQDFSPYGAFYMLQHLSRMQRPDLAEDLIERFYSVMLRHSTGTIWEQFNSNKSLCHAWSAAPTWYLSTNVLGVQMGFDPQSTVDEIIIEPQAENISWAKGTVPHPLGDVHVSWKKMGNHLYLDCSAPDGAQVSVQPRGSFAALESHVNTGVAS